MMCCGHEKGDDILEPPPVAGTCTWEVAYVQDDIAPEIRANVELWAQLHSRVSSLEQPTSVNPLCAQV